MKKLIEKYELLSREVKYQVSFIDDYSEFDFEYLGNVLNEMKELQKKINDTQ